MDQRRPGRKLDIADGDWVVIENELAREAAQGRLRDRLAEALGPGARGLDALALCGSPEAIRDYLSAQHYRLFHDPYGPVELAESVYKE